MMHKRAVELIQQELKRKGHPIGRVDGTAGVTTMRALQKYLDANTATLPPEASTVSNARKLNFAMQLLAKEAGLDADPVDGFWGPVTEHAFESLHELRRTGQPPVPFRDDASGEANPNHWPRDNRQQTEMRSFFGPPGNPPMRKVRCPWPLRLAWDRSQRITQINVHEKVADSLERIFTRVHQHYGDAELQRLRLDLFGGSFAPRRKRGGTTWSTHAWATAIDWDPERNKLKWSRDRAALADPVYTAWWHAWEAEGWLSLGRARNFDWMHVQAARL
jgi:hypothetical protein